MLTVAPRRGIARRAVVVAVLVACAARARAIDVTGSYAGTLSLRALAPAPASAALTQSGTTVTGTVVLELAGGGGAFQVQGPARGRRLRLVGGDGSGTTFVWRGRIKGSDVTGPIRMRSAQGRVSGKLALARNDLQSGSAAACDAVYAQNRTFFETQVMGRVLSICARCHVDGGQAQATRLRVTAGDPLATARSTALLVDQANPAASRLLQKPLALTPHGGGRQIVAGSAQERILRQWIDLLARANCVGSAGSGNGAGDAWVRSCASCHGADGTGGGGAPDVRCTVRSLLTDAVRRGRGTVMPAFSSAEVSGAGLRQIAAYLGGLCTGKPADVFASNCATCHGPTGGGGRNADGVGGPNIRCSESSDFFEAVRFGGEGMPAFGGLGSSAIKGLATYVRGLCSLGGGGD